MRPRSAPRADLEAEIQVIGSVLHDPTLLLQIDLRAPEFSAPEHQLIWAAMKRLQERSEPIDNGLVARELEATATDDDESALQRIGGSAGLAKIAHAVTTPANAANYASHVREAYQKRLIHSCASRAAAAATNGKPAGEILAELQMDLDILSRSTTKRERFRTYTLRELLTGDFSVEWLCPGLIAKRQPFVIGGPSKALKTTLACNLCIAAVLGGRFLNQFRFAKPTRTVFMSGESGDDVIAEIMQVMWETMGSREIPDTLTVTGDLPRLGDATDLLEMMRLLDRTKPDLLIIDPFYLAAPDAELADLFRQGALLRPLADLCKERGITLCIVHHTRKTGIERIFEPLTLEDLAGAGVTEFFRQWILVNRRERFEPGSGVHRLWLNAGGSANHSGLWAVDIDQGQFPDRRWDVTVMTGTDARSAAEDLTAQRKAKQKEKTDERHKRELYEAMTKFPDGETAHVLRGVAGLSGSSFGVAIRFLLAEGRAEKCEIKKCNGVHDGFRLTGK